MLAQLNFQMGFQNWKSELRNQLAKGNKCLGGGQGKRKVARPLSPRLPVHLVMKTANPAYSLLRPRLARMVRRVVSKQASRFHIVIRQFVIAPDQVHLLLEFRNRQEFSGFLRSVAGLIARFALGRERGMAGRILKKSPGTFWEGRPLTRSIEGLNLEPWLFTALDKKKSLCESVRITLLEAFLLTPTTNTS